MYHALSLHYQIQRRSHVETRIAIVLLACLLLLFGFTSVWIHIVAESTETTIHTSRDEVLDLRRELRNKLRTKKRPRKLGPLQFVKSSPSPKDNFEQEHVYRPLEAPSDPNVFESPYNIMNCPKEPPANYPNNFNVVDVLTNWNPDDTNVPDRIHQSLCVLDWDRHRTVVERYRTAEVPFILRGHPEVVQTAVRWSSEGYLEALLGKEWQRNEFSHNNHMMYWKARGGRMPRDFVPPTENVELTFPDWLEKARQLENVSDHTSHDHWYLRLNGQLPNKNVYLFDELPFFQPRDHPTTFMIDSSQQRGINCRFGMKGIIAEAHFDPTRNWIVNLGGQRRYILAHPDQCPNLELYPSWHPSGRHSSVNWSRIADHDGPFVKARVQEVVMGPGDALYLPASWFHFIVNLNINYQCNARSGTTHENDHYIRACGFDLPSFV